MEQLEDGVMVTLQEKALDSWISLILHLTTALSINVFIHLLHLFSNIYLI